MSQRRRVVLGLDPGLERIGYGIVVKEGSRLAAGEYGLITTPRITTADRLVQIEADLRALISRTQPSEVALERLFYAKNQTTVIDVAKAIGVMQFACATAGLPMCDYSPPEIKRAVVGNGRAEKRQVQFMVTKLLGLREAPRPDDVADALAIAITHALASP